MKEHQSMRETRVIPRAMVPLANGEAARCGEAQTALNVREQQQALQVTGQPATMGAMPVGEQLLLLTGSHRVTCSGLTVKVDNVAVATAADEIVGAHAIGPLVVVVTRSGFIYLTQTEGSGWLRLDPDDAVPQLAFSAQTATMSADMAAYTFAEPYA